MKFLIIAVLTVAVASGHLTGHHHEHSSELGQAIVHPPAVHPVNPGGLGNQRFPTGHSGQHHHKRSADPHKHHHSSEEVFVHAPNVHQLNPHGLINQGYPNNQIGLSNQHGGLSIHGQHRPIHKRSADPHRHHHSSEEVFVQTPNVHQLNPNGLINQGYPNNQLGLANQHGGLANHGQHRPIHKRSADPHRHHHSSEEVFVQTPNVHQLNPNGLINQGYPNNQIGLANQHGGRPNVGPFGGQTNHGNLGHAGRVPLQGGRGSYESEERVGY